MAPIAEADLSHSSSDSPIDVLIVGTGLAGLTAALECHRKGMNVRIMERYSTINTAGDTFFLGLSATRLFRNWPEMKEEYDAISLHDAYLETFRHTGVPLVKAMPVAVRLRAQGLDPNTPPGTFQIRPLVYKMLVHQVEKLGIKIEFDHQVVEYYENLETGKGGVVTKDGKKHEADLVIAADGVGSKSQVLVGGQVRAVPSGRAMWRAAFPIEHLDKNPEVKEFFSMVDGKHPIVRTFLGPAAYALTLTRPDTMIWIMNHDTTGTEMESWNNTIESEEVLTELDKLPGAHKWAPIFQELVKCTPEKTIINFNLLWRDPQPSWTSPGARVVQIGDSAHSFLPASGNGATLAIEDAISLATCLKKGGKNNIEQAVRAHIRFRFTRTACAQKLGFSNAELLQETNWDTVVDPRKSAPKHPAWVFEHDAETYAETYYEKTLASMKKGIAPTDDETVPPNYPRGYKYEPWGIDQIIEDKKMGRETHLGSGDWD
ncbi:monooxygenase fad-binding protein [Rutstroemia sp. NJR-2017a BBW]|nr:monooxygenase fad-binding protein [Rutstroemia sp. NJR-2017a BBW]